MGLDGPILTFLLPSYAIGKPNVEKKRVVFSSYIPKRLISKRKSSVFVEKKGQIGRKNEGKRIINQNRVRKEERKGEKMKKREKGQ